MFVFYNVVCGRGSRGFVLASFCEGLVGVPEGLSCNLKAFSMGKELDLGSIELSIRESIRMISVRVLEIERQFLSICSSSFWMRSQSSSDEGGFPMRVWI